MKTAIIDGERYVSFGAYKEATLSLRRQLAQAQLELDRTRARSTNLRKAIKGLEIAVAKLKAHELTCMLQSLVDAAVSPRYVVEHKGALYEHMDNVA